MSSTLSLRDAERRISYSIQEIDVLTDVIAEVETCIEAPGAPDKLAPEVAGLLEEIHGKLCGLLVLAAANASRPEGVQKTVTAGADN